MPELPEVETIRRGLNARFAGKKIRSVLIQDATILTDHRDKSRASADEFVSRFKKSVEGKTVSDFGRKAKYLAMEFMETGAVLLHLRMTGQLRANDGGRKPRAEFTFEDGLKLFFIDQRRFGEISYSLDWKSEPRVRKLGLEAVDSRINGAFLKELFRNRTAPVHSILLNQNLLSGLGNIYATEALFHSGISPFRKSHSVTSARLEKLASSMRKVLRDSIRHRGYSMRTYVDALGKKGRSQLFSVVYGKEGKPCVQCGSALKRAVITGRGVVYCARCQK